MIQYPSIDPVIFSIGPVAVRWYGMMYLLGFLAAFWLGKRQCRKPWAPLQAGQVEDLIFYGALGAVLGGRLGYVFFYGFERFAADPLWLFRIWEGGMAFHGGLLGVFFALILYARALSVPLGALADFVAPLAPIGLGLGRLANFINAELYGRQSDVPWAMVFPTDPQGLTRHPSQLYQAFLEGVLLFAIVYWFARRPRPAWSITGVFLAVYGTARFVVEFFREPDATLAFDLVTRGQLLSMPMIVAGVIMVVLAYRNAGTSQDLGTSPENPGVKASAGSPTAKARVKPAKRGTRRKKKKK